MNNIQFETLKNARDLGGIEVNGGTVKAKKFLRTPTLYNTSKKDIEKLVKEYNLGLIIDLRTNMEKSQKEDPNISGVKYLHMPIFNERFPGITHESQEDFDRDFKNFNVDLAKMYRGMLEGEYLEKISNIIQVIMNSDEEKSVIFHCTEGKDRTGIIAAIILLILGASKEDVKKDYLYTNIVNKKKANKYYWLVLLFKFSKTRAKNIKNVFLAKQEYIDSALDVIFKDYSGVDNFIYDGLKLEKDDVQRFRERYIVRGE